MNNRYDFIYLFDVQDGNPNGDPDAGNLPRIDPETGDGLITDVCMKRKIRNFVGLTKGDQPPYEIYIKEKAVLNNQHQRSYQAIGEKSESKKLPKDAQKAKAITEWMCKNFFDIRTFGAVMTTEVNAGQVRGPVQLSFARSITPIVASEHAITRMAVTTEKEADKQQGDNRTMGRKFTVPYGLYLAHGFVNPFLAAQTGFDANGEDLNLLWASLLNMFEFDRSAARGLMAPRSIIIFKHASALGSAPAHKLFQRVTVKLNDGITSPRAFTDYTVTINRDDLPPGVEIIEM